MKIIPLVVFLFLFSSFAEDIEQSYKKLKSLQGEKYLSFRYEFLQQDGVLNFLKKKSNDYHVRALELRKKKDSSLKLYERDKLKYQIAFPQKDIDFQNLLYFNVSNYFDKTEKFYDEINQTLLKIHSHSSHQLLSNNSYIGSGNQKIIDKDLGRFYHDYLSLELERIVYNSENETIVERCIKLIYLFGEPSFYSFTPYPKGSIEVQLTTVSSWFNQILIDSNIPIEIKLTLVSILYPSWNAQQSLNKHLKLKLDIPFPKILDQDYLLQLIFFAKNKYPKVLYLGEHLVSPTFIRIRPFPLVNEEIIIKSYENPKILQQELKRLNISEEEIYPETEYMDVRTGLEYETFHRMFKNDIAKNILKFNKAKENYQNLSSFFYRKNDPLYSVKTKKSLIDVFYK